MKKISEHRRLLTILIFIFMGFFSFFKRSSAQVNGPHEPYKTAAVNTVYNLLFCDNVKLYKEITAKPYVYPFNVLFSGSNTIGDLQKITKDPHAEPRIKVLAYNQLLAKRVKPDKKELLAVIVEIGLDNGLDVLASFSNGTARYINQTGKILVWETTTDQTANELTRALFTASQKILPQIGPWDKARRPYPTKGNMRITFLVADGLYLGEGPIDVLFQDPIAGPALQKATALMKYLTTKQ